MFGRPNTLEKCYQRLLNDTIVGCVGLNLSLISEEVKTLFGTKSANIPAAVGGLVLLYGIVDYTINFHRLSRLGYFPDDPTREPITAETEIISFPEQPYMIEETTVPKIQKAA